VDVEANEESALGANTDHEVDNTPAKEGSEALGAAPADAVADDFGGANTPPPPATALALMDLEEPLETAASGIIDGTAMVG
jgi:hypothetical protein